MTLAFYIDAPAILVRQMHCHDLLVNTLRLWEIWLLPAFRQKTTRTATWYLLFMSCQTQHLGYTLLPGTTPSLRKRWNTSSAVGCPLDSMVTWSSFTTVLNECLMIRDTVVVPESLRSVLLKQSHSGHPSTKRMKSIVRSYTYCPLLDEHVVELVD